MNMREQRFDLIKGVAIFLVVIGHVLTFCIREIDNAFLFKIVAAVHMPLFFFVSGWFSYKEGFRSPDLLKRFRQLIVPGLICMTLFFFAFPHTGVGTPFPKTYESAIATSGKYGYWFVFTLFMITIYYWVITKIVSFINSEKLKYAVVIILSLLVFTFTNIENLWTQALCMDFASLYFPPFIFGVLARKNRSGFENLCNNGYVYMSSLIIGCFCFYPLTYSWEFPGLQTAIRFATPVLHICLAIVAMPLFTNWEKTAFSPDSSALGRSSARMWAYIGRNSLGIYLLHYFFLFPMGVLQEPMRELHCGIIPTLTVSAFVASVIIAVVLLVIKILSPSPQLSELLTGTLTAKRK